MSKKESISDQKEKEVKSSGNDVVNKSILLDKSIKRLDSNKKLQIQEKTPYIDEDGDVCLSEIPCRTSKRREVVVTRIPTKVELKTLTHLAKRPAVDIEFQDLSYTVRNPGKSGKLYFEITYNYLYIVICVWLLSVFIIYFSRVIKVCYEKFVS